jgi:hypothetical protein
MCDCSSVKKRNGVMAWDSAERDVLSCSCGNTPMADGFYTADQNTWAVVEPNVGEWDGLTWYCGGCGVVGVPTTPAANARCFECGRVGGSLDESASLCRECERVVFDDRRGVARVRRNPAEATA